MTSFGVFPVALYLLSLGGWLGPWPWLQDWDALLGVDGFSALSLTAGLVGLLSFERRLLRRILGLVLFVVQTFTLSFMLAQAAATNLEGLRWGIAPLQGVGWMAFAAACWWPSDTDSQPNFGLMAIWVAMACGALMLLAFAFGADQLLGHKVATSLLEALAFSSIAIGFLIRYPQQPFEALTSRGAAAELRRHLLPPSLIIPISIGAAMMLARVFMPDLEFSSVVAVAVLANLSLNVWVLNRAGEQLRLLDRRRQEKQAAKEERVRKQGQRDSVTKLLNRAGWDAEVKQAESLCRKKKLEACVFIIDLDGLKQINDSAGHQAGDAFIAQAAQALKRVARQKDALARLGGDEFGYLAVGCDDQGALALRARLTKALEDAGVPASLGYALKGRGTIADAIERADEAMYVHKKERGGGRR